jgi:predicted benzoate:H+ symporter BenE
MLPSARREDGAEQPCIKAGMFRIRLPFVHAPWEIPEMIQAMVVFLTGVSAMAYLQDIFGLDASIALAIVTVHEFLYIFQNIVGDPIVGGWITPALPLVSAWLLTFEGFQDRVEALIALQLILGILYILLGCTGLASKLVSKVPASVKSGILMGAGISAVIGKYGFKAVEDGGVGFYKQPISFSVGVLVALFLLFSVGFGRLKQNKDNKFVQFIAKCGFVPALLVAYIVGMLVGEIDLPTGVLSGGLIFNPLPGLKYAFHNFSLVGLGLPSKDIILSALPMACIAYIISFGDIVAGTEFLEDAKKYRPDEDVRVNPNLTNICCGVRNIIQALFCPTVTMSGPLWSAMMVTVCERYKTGKENMYSYFGGAITFNVMKWICCLIVPLLALVTPILPLSMSLTLMIQAFGCFYVALGICENNVQRGVAGLIGGILAVTNPQTGLIAGIIISIICEYLMGERFLTVKQREKLNETVSEELSVLENASVAEE